MLAHEVISTALKQARDQAGPADRIPPGTVTNKSFMSISKNELRVHMTALCVAALALICSEPETGARPAIRTAFFENYP